LKIEKKISWESSFPLFYPSKGRDGKVKSCAGLSTTSNGKVVFPPRPLREKIGKVLSQGILFSTFKYPFHPWTIFFSQSRKKKCFTREFLFS
jgi:hypothetical protein